MGIDLTTQTALNAHRESSLRSATAELLLGESRDELQATTNRIARAAETEGNRSDRDTPEDRRPQGEDRPNRSSRDRGRIFDVSV